MLFNRMEFKSEFGSDATEGFAFPAPRGRLQPDRAIEGR